MGGNARRNRPKKNRFLIVNYPWIFNANAKSRMLRIEAKIE